MFRFAQKIGETMIKTEFSNVTVVDHPLCEHNLALIRNKDISCDGFRNALRRLSYMLIYEATKQLPTAVYSVQTPLAVCNAQMLNKNVKTIFAPILRAGLALSEVAGEIIPDASIQHVGMYRDEVTLKPVWYYDKTPVEYTNPQDIRVFILDPMLATGNSALAAVSLFLKRGISIENIVFVSVVSAPDGIMALNGEFPDLKIITAKIDEGLNARGYILPGLGDAGDRFFNTFEK